MRGQETIFLGTPTRAELNRILRGRRWLARRRPPEWLQPYGSAKPSAAPSRTTARADDL